MYIVGLTPLLFFSGVQNKVTGVWGRAPLLINIKSKKGTCDVPLLFVFSSKIDPHDRQIQPLQEVFCVFGILFIHHEARRLHQRPHMHEVFSVKIIDNVLSVQNAFDQRHVSGLYVTMICSYSIYSGFGSGRSSLTRSTLQSAQTEKPSQYSVLHFGQNMVTPFCLKGHEKYVGAIHELPLRNYRISKNSLIIFILNGSTLTMDGS